MTQGQNFFPMFEKQSFAGVVEKKEQKLNIFNADTLFDHPDIVKDWSYTKSGEQVLTWTSTNEQLLMLHRMCLITDIYDNREEYTCGMYEFRFDKGVISDMKKSERAEYSYSLITPTAKSLCKR